jgi:hypothetical protein
MNRAVTVVVITNRAVEQMIAEDTVKSLSLRLIGCRGIRDDTHSGCNGSSARPDKTAVNFYHAGVARLDRAKLRVITNLRHFAAATVDDINEMLIRLCFLDQTINRDSEHSYSPSRQISPTDQRLARIYFGAGVYGKAFLRSFLALRRMTLCCYCCGSQIPRLQHQESWDRSVVPVMPTMAPATISMPLDQVSGSGPSTGANQCALATTEQCTSN